MTNLYPVANVLVVERRTCSCCKLVFCAPSEVIHELRVTAEGSDYERDMAPLAYPPPCSTASLRTTRYVDRTVSYCHFCWRDNIKWNDAAAIRPTARKSTSIGPLSDLRVRPGIIPATIDELM